MPLLSVNIDHIASVRQARYRDLPPGSDLGEPDPARAAHEAELGGADGITIHLREDRRHIHDRDAELLRRLVRVKFNLEMAATPEMVAIAGRLRPHTVMLVPEGRNEVTTEGGLDITAHLSRVREAVAELKGNGLLISAFIDADAGQIEAAAKLGVDVCEIHTGPYAHAFAAAGGDFRRRELLTELRRVRDASTFIVDAGMRCNAGHALNYANVGPIAQIVALANTTRAGGSAAGPSTADLAATLEPAARATAHADRGELHIGHAIISRAVFTGLRAAVGEMKHAINAAVQSLGAASGVCGDGHGLQLEGPGAPLDLPPAPAAPRTHPPRSTPGPTRLA